MLAGVTEKRKFVVNRRKLLWRNLFQSCPQAINFGVRERAKEERSKIKDVRKKCCLIFFFFWMGNINSLPQEKERTTGKTK